MYYKTAAHEECRTEECNREGDTQRRGKGRDGKVCSFHRKTGWVMDKTGRMKLLEADTERENTHTHTLLLNVDTEQEFHWVTNLRRLIERMLFTIATSVTCRSHMRQETHTEWERKGEDISFSVRTNKVTEIIDSRYIQGNSHLIPCKLVRGQ